MSVASLVICTTIFAAPHDQRDYHFPSFSVIRHGGFQEGIESELNPKHFVSNEDSEMRASLKHAWSWNKQSFIKLIDAFKKNVLKVSPTNYGKKKSRHMQEG